MVGLSRTEYLEWEVGDENINKVKKFVWWKNPSKKKQRILLQFLFFSGDILLQFLWEKAYTINCWKILSRCNGLIYFHFQHDLHSWTYDGFMSVHINMCTQTFQVEHSYNRVKKLISIKIKNNVYLWSSHSLQYLTYKYTCTLYILWITYRTVI